VRFGLVGSLVWVAACGVGEVKITDDGKADTDTVPSVDHGDEDTDVEAPDTDAPDTDRSDTDPLPGDTDARDTDTGTPPVTPPALSRTFGVPQPLTELNTASDELHGTMTADRLRICFASNRPGAMLGSYDLWCAARATASAPFGAALPQLSVNTGSSELDPTISADGAELFFRSDRSGGDELYRAVWDAGVGLYANPAAVTDLNSVDGDSAPSLSADGRSLVFTSDRSGALWSYNAVRASAGGAFTSVAHIEHLEDLGVARDPALSRDGASIVFSSSRPWTGFSTAFSTQLWAADGGQGVFGAPYIVVFDDFEQPLMTGPCPLSDGSLLFSANHNVNAGLLGDQDLFVAAPEVGVTDPRGLLPRTFPSAGPRAGHQVGRASAFGWTADPALDYADHMLYGPYTQQIPAGLHTASFRLRVNSLSAAQTSVANIDVWSASGNAFRGQRTVYWNEFSNTGWLDFDVNFQSVEGDVLETRVYFLDATTLSVDSVTVR
jgi:hypothetical protein